MNKTEIKIKKWYKDKYPEDNLVTAIRSDVTFDDIHSCLDRHDNLYSVIGTGDSVIRERIFVKLTELLNSDNLKISYSDIYQTWLGNRKTVLKG